MDLETHNMCVLLIEGNLINVVCIEFQFHINWTHIVMAFKWNQKEEGSKMKAQMLQKFPISSFYFVRINFYFMDRTWSESKKKSLNIVAECLSK